MRDRRAYKRLRPPIEGHQGPARGALRVFLDLAALVDWPAVGLLVVSAIVLPSSEASARCWHNGWGWRCGPGLLALPFIATGAVVAGAAGTAAVSS